VSAPEVEARCALVLHARQLLVDLIQLTLSHGLFVVRTAHSLAEAEAILAEWHPHLAAVDMDHDDSTALLGRLGVSEKRVVATATAEPFGLGLSCACPDEAPMSCVPR
jgi:DNA-binding response OmpR family regulator